MDFRGPFFVLEEATDQFEDEVVFFASKDVATKIAAAGEIIDDATGESVEGRGDFGFFDDGVAVDEHFGEALVNFGGGVGVKDEGENVLGGDAALGDEIDDFRDEGAGFARASTGDDERV